jgi:hypothetical protein
MRHNLEGRGPTVFGSARLNTVTIAEASGISRIAQGANVWTLARIAYSLFGFYELA